jgi:hypothetical protein
MLTREACAKVEGGVVCRLRRWVSVANHDQVAAAEGIRSLRSTVRTIGLSTHPL